MTAADVKYCFDRILDARSGSKGADYFRDKVKGAAAYYSSTLDTTGSGTVAPEAQDVRARVRPGRVARATVRVRNVGGTRGRFVLPAPSSPAAGALRLTDVHRGVVRTRALPRRGWRPPSHAPGESLRLKVRVEAGPSASPGRRVLSFTAASPTDRDRVRLLVRVRRPGM